RCKMQLPPDLGTGRLFVRLDICAVGKLAWKKDVLFPPGEFLGHLDTADESALFSTDRDDFGSKAANQRDAFLTHPVRHEDDHRMTKRPAYRRERDAGVAAGRFHDRVARSNLFLEIGLLENVKGHSVLDAAGQVQVLSLCINYSSLAPERELDAQQRCIT